jgi:uncharacterized repeat protein (TIGR01451 family)
MVVMGIFIVNLAFTGPVAATVWTINETDHGMVTNSNIQKIIDNAQPGDTILFTGNQYTMINLAINKPLNIISTVGTQVYSCEMMIPSGSDELTAFSIYGGASGTNLTGFNIHNNNAGYAVNINNTTNIQVSNCSMSSWGGVGLNMRDSQNITINNNTLYSSATGIKLNNSSSASITNNIITNNDENGILFASNVSNTLINGNNITSNKYIGINIFESCNNTTITSNSITQNVATDSNDGYGIYINTTINGLNITGNYIFKNGNFGICNDLGVTTLVNGTETLNNNFISGHVIRDVVRYIDDGTGEIVRAPVWIGETCFGGAKRLCPSAVVSGEAVLGNITTKSNGIFSVSFVDSKTGINQTGFGSFYVTFFLNKNDTTKGSADIGDVWQNVLVKNGTATVDFGKYDFKSANNTIFALAPYLSFQTAQKTLYHISNSDIPKLTLSSTLNTTKTVIKNGESIIYKFTVKNSNNRDATNLKISNILSSNYFTSSAKPSQGTYSNGIWNIGTLKAGSSLSISINAVAKKSGVIKSQAQISGSNVNPTFSNSAQVTVNKYVNLAYKNTLSTTKVKKGGYAYVRTTITNTGKDSSDLIKVYMSLPTGVKRISTNYPSEFNKTSKIWGLKIPAGKSVTLTTKVQVTNKGTKTIKFNNNGKTVNKSLTAY